MNIVLIVPTGIDAVIGGHAGDANPVAKLFGPLCDNLITHPNVVNASDINEMPHNTWYVEGSILDRFLRGEIGLKQPATYNRILVAVNKPVKTETINSVSAARATIGADISIVELEKPLELIGGVNENARACGTVNGWEDLVAQIKGMDFDALAITTAITVPREMKLAYYKSNVSTNPWGYVEAKASKLIACALDKPVAHAPAMEVTAESDPEVYFFQEIVDPRISAELVSVSYLHCVLKGLHCAPRVTPLHSCHGDYNPSHALTNRDVSVMIAPWNCWGDAHKACVSAGIPILAVRENMTRALTLAEQCVLQDHLSSKVIPVENYLEAAGWISCMKAGIDSRSVRRPLAPTIVRRTENGTL